MLYQHMLGQLDSGLVAQREGLHRDDLATSLLERTEARHEDRDS